VVTTTGAWADSGKFVFVEISQGKELRFSAGLVAEHLRPKSERKVRIPEKTTTDAEGNVSVTENGRWEMQTTVDPTNTWMIANVMMVEQVNGLSYRRGICKVLLSAWYKMHTHRTFVYVA
jgi:hypothetical protein